MAAFEELSHSLSQDFPQIRAARERTGQVVESLTNNLLSALGTLPHNVGIVLFGSLARKEFSTGSDVDWTLLSDGPADPEHFRLAVQIRDALDAGGYPQPGATGTFGELSSSHELIHQIGGIDDTNKNLTRRVLLLLESCSVADDLVRRRVLQQVLHRYIACDQSVSWLTSPKPKTPRFLLNDVIRFWRTMAVDYAAKKWQQSGGKWAIRNAKLRLSRKLLLVKGLLLCFECERIDKQAGDADAIMAALVGSCLEVAETPPLDKLCVSLIELGNAAASKQILTAYDAFLGMLSDEGTRQDLEKLRFEDAPNNSTFAEIRRLSAEFQAGLDELFFVPSSPWWAMIKKYGVF